MRAEELIYALDYIEENVRGQIRIAEIAEHCYSSLSGLQKAFKFAFGISINEYILRRKYTRAANELLSTDRNILDIALDYGYSNAESFTRGFQKVWQTTPKEFRKNRKFAVHTPKLSLPQQTKEGILMNKVQYDITELYEVLQERKNNAYVCVDLERLMEINDRYGTEAGDAALLEVMRRLEDACGANDFFMRIGGDEFVIWTGSADMAYAEDIVLKIAKQNEQTVTCGNNTFPVSVRIGAFSKNFKEAVRANEMFNVLAADVKTVKKPNA